MTQNGRKNKGGYGARQSARQRKKRIRLIAILSAAAFLIVAGLIVGLRVRKHMSDAQLEAEVTAHQDTFEEGVTINGMALTGYSKEEAQALLDSHYEESLSSEIELVFEDRSWTFTPRDMGAKIDAAEQVDAAWEYGKNGTLLERQAEIHALAEEPVDLTVTLTYDRSALQALAQQIKSEIDTDPVSATMEIVEIGKFAYTDSSTGWDLDADALVDKLEELIREGKAGRVTVEPAVVEPEVSREQLEHSTVLLGECYTSLDGSSSSRTSNVNLALSFFNFMTIEPGAKVSFNKVVGQRTELT
ncbi:MAG: peptidoglycan binding domain-containing protein, partial [Clostridia bacterium]|nr:peptidoglycan binding domain-containing protein [Clostridia bacterium]